MSIIYNGFDSLNTFNIYPASKEIPSPKRKTASDTVPYMSGIWDFSQDEYEPITVKYTFDIIAENKRELNLIRKQVENWINGVNSNKTLYDTDISTTDYFHVYHGGTDWSEVDLQAVFTAEFVCYPFMFTPYFSETKSLSSTNKTITVNNDGSHTAKASVTVTGSCTLTFNSTVYTLSAGTYKELLILNYGTNDIKVKGSGSATVTYRKEVFP